MIGKLETQCPQCSSKIRFTLDDAAAQRTVRCSRGHRVALKDPKGEVRKTRDADRKLEKALKDLQRTARRIGR